MKNKIFAIMIILCLLLTGCKAANVEETALSEQITESANEELNSSSGEDNKTPSISENQPEKETSSENEQDTETESEEEYTDVLTKLKKEYPNATITEQDGKYSVISDNIDFTSIQNTESHGTSDRSVYYTMDALFNTMSSLRHCIFIGKKTGETKQYIPINSNGLVGGLYYTQSKVKVTKALYGDISEGDVIVLREFYAVFRNGEKSVLLYSEQPPISNDEYFYTVASYPEKTLFGDDHYYYPKIDGCFSMEYGRKLIDSKEEVIGTDVTAKELYEKYIVKGDVALDKEAEIAKAQKVAGENPLSAEQLAKIDELCKKYGEVKK